MSAARKRKFDDDGGLFNREWCSKYLVVPHSQVYVCLVGQNKITVLKEYDVKRQYPIKQTSKFDEILGQTRVVKKEQLKEIH